MKRFSNPVFNPSFKPLSSPVSISRPGLTGGLSLILILSLLLSACTPPPPASVIPLERFQKLRADGSEVGMQDGPWQCVLDRQTRLVWEVKQANENAQFALSTYSWFDGVNGSAKGGSCGVDLPGMPFMSYQACDTQDLLNHLRQKKLCGFDDWRLPRTSELRTILIKHGYPGETLLPFPLLPRVTFGPYWSADSRAGENGVPQVRSLHVGTGEEGWISSSQAAYAMAVTQKSEAKPGIDHSGHSASTPFAMR